MKKSIKRLITVFAVCAVSAFAVVASGCNLTDKIKEKIEQARCEHEWNDGEVTKEATCTEKGELTKTCTLCEKVETEEIELAEHIAVYVQAVTPTCSEKGITDGTVCSVCETKLSGFQEIPALGHIVVKDSAVKPTCLEEGLTEGEHCSRCNEVLKAQEKVPATGHNLVILEAVEPTCTTEGKTQGVFCDKCETVFTEQNIIDTTHDYENGACVKCGRLEYIYSEDYNYTEEDVVVGDKVAGYWYRITRADTQMGPESNYGFSFEVNVADLDLIRTTSSFFDSGSTLIFFIYASPKDNTLTLNVYNPLLGLKGELEAEVYEDYIDIYVPLNGKIEVYNAGVNDMVGLTFTEDLVVKSIADGVTVKRLVPKPVTAE